MHMALYFNSSIIFHSKIFTFKKRYTMPDCNFVPTDFMMYCCFDVILASLLLAIGIPVWEM